MSLLIFAYRKQYIIRRKSELNMKLLNLRQKLMDLQSYSASIADGAISINDLVNAPASMFNRMSIFATSSHQAAEMGAQQNIGPMLAMAQAQGTFANMQAEQQQQYQKMIFSQLYKQEKEKIKAQETKILNQEDTKIQQEAAKVETELKMLDSEESKVEEAETKAAEKSAPKYSG